MFRSLISGTIIAVALGPLGCSGPGAQLTQCQSEKEQLLATIREQRDANRSLETQVASLESRLDESEKEIARGGRSGARLSSVNAGKGAVANALRGAASAAADSKLNWKSPPAKPAASSALAALAARDKRLALDRAQGVGRLNVPIAFADNSATLTAADKRQLDEVAKLLKSKDAAELHVLISGFAEGRPPKSGDGAFASARQLGTARAQAVADYLDRHGIAEERLAVAAAGSPRGDASAAGSSGVQILVAEKDAALAGWGSGGETIRR
jgi:outer membrane protein OmpA-like peptidoglycan-associated protein